MKLIRFSRGGAKPRFGIVIGDRAVAFTSLQPRSGITQPDMSDSQGYLAGLPESERAARELAAWARRIWATCSKTSGPASGTCVCTSRSRWRRCSTSG